MIVATWVFEGCGGGRKRKSIGRSGTDGGQPTDVMEIILTGPAHWDLGG